jgi:sugar phosphate isomerase/epimerase
MNHKAINMVEGNIDDFGMDTITMNGSLEGKLAAIKEAGFSQVMLLARDLTGHPQGWRKAAEVVRSSGLRVTGFQVLRDFEGLSGHLHEYKVDIAKSMLEMAHAVGAKVLLACSSTSTHATSDPQLLARDLRKLAMLAVPMGIRIAFEALSWGRHVNVFPQAWDLIAEADMPNLGLGFDSYHMLAMKTQVEDLELVDPSKIFLVQLADFMWNEIKSVEERITTARTFRVFPGEGVHSAELAAITLQLHRMGYRGDYSFEVFNDDYQGLPVEKVAARARRAALWLGEQVLQRSVPLSNQMRLKA